MKRIFLIFVLVFFINGVLAEPVLLDSTNNAKYHNNMGLEYLRANRFNSALGEFNIALSLNPNSQTSAIYNYNIANTHLIIYKYNSNSKHLDIAEKHLKEAISLDCMQFDYYEKLSDVYKLKGKLNEKLEFYKNDSKNNPFSKIMVALIYEKMGNLETAKKILKDFSANNKNLIITPAIKSHLRKVKYDT